MIKTDLKLRFKIFTILSKNELSKKRIDYLFLNEKIFENLEKSEINFIQKVVYGIIRNKSKLDYYISHHYNGNYKKLLIKYKIILRIGLYQIIYLDSVPNYASVNSTVNLIKIIDKNKTSLINAIMRKLSLNKEFFKIPIKDDYINYSHPQWLVKKWYNTWSKSDVRDILKWNLEEPKIWFRMNLYKSSTKIIISFLNKNKIKYTVNENLSEFLYCDKPQLILKSDLIKNGFLSVQNPANGLVVQLLDPKPSQKILDGCSAPGGKGMYINELTKGEAFIYSYEKNFNRFKKLKNRFKLLEYNNISCSSKDLEVDEINFFDNGLIDVPCSGTGVISKRVDLKWRRKRSDIDEMCLIQKNILSNVSKYLKVGGAIVYSTCSIENEENWQIIINFLNSNNNFKLDRAEKYIPKRYVDENGCLSIYPPRDKIDGIFAARMIKYV